MKLNRLLLLSKNFIRYKSEHCKYKNFDLEYLCSPKNTKEIQDNISHRKGIGDIVLVQKLYNEIKNSNSIDTISNLETKLYEEILKIPNRTHPDIFNHASNNPRVVRYIGNKKEFTSKPLEFHEIAKALNLARTDQLGYFAGSKSYYFLGDLANLEQALIQYALSTMIKNNFELITVPDLLPPDIIEKCGFSTKGARTQIYSIDSELHKVDMCLSGTSEMALANYVQNKTFEEEKLPLKLTSVSRCYRAETSKLAEERGIYRVHEFTKVEMFVISTPEQSDGMLENIRGIQEKHFESLDIYFQVLDMPPHELGASAYRKYDIEAWMPGRNMFGEISSCSNCTDYQSRRLGIKYKTKSGEIKYAHTLNGTVSAIPRLLIALVESGQTNKGTITLPSILHKYMHGKTFLAQQKHIPRLKLVKRKM